MTAEKRPIRRTRLLALLVLVATFAAGALVGIASERVLNPDEPQAPAERRGRYSERNLFGPQGTLTQRLGLTQAQREEIESILAADRAKADSILREMRPRLRARYDSTTARIRGVLSPAQQEEFDRFRGERRERIRMIHKEKAHRRDDEGR